jgi:hypothetical protein
MEKATDYVKGSGVQFMAASRTRSALLLRGRVVVWCMRNLGKEKDSSCVPHFTIKFPMVHTLMLISAKNNITLNLWISEECYT